MDALGKPMFGGKSSTFCIYGKIESAQTRAHPETNDLQSCVSSAH